MNRNHSSNLQAFLAAAVMLGAVLQASVRAEDFPALNMPATPNHVPGKFIWADMFTSNPDAAATFYCGLLGWTQAPFEQKDRSYIILTNGDHPVAGIVQRKASSQKRSGVWIGYISVANARDAVAAAVAAGGTEHAPARNFPARGFQAIVTDIEGSPVGILQSTSGDPADDEPNVGEWNWFELYSLKARATADFYAAAFGYKVETDMRSEKSDHLLLSSSGQTRAGVAPLPSSPDSAPGWLPCVRVADIEATVAKTESLGGSVVIAPRPAALGSRFAVVADPTGGTVGLVQYLDNANPAARP
jgi:predicted enzyme related to lactoylglutathione lyase